MTKQFEFMGDASLGQYIPRDSWFHARDPRARLITYGVLLFAATFTRTFVGLGLSLFVSIIIYGIALIQIKPTLKAILKALPFLLLLSLFQFFLTPGEPLLTVMGLSITRAGLIQSGLLILRFLVLIFLLNALVMTLSTAQMSAALFYLLKPLSHVGFPVNDLTMVVQVTLRFIPLIAQSAEKIAKAQAARGADWDQRGFNPIQQARRVVPLIVPLVVNSLHNAETMAIAMDSRGFNAAEERSSFYALNFQALDGMMVMSAILSAILVIIIPGIFV